MGVDWIETVIERRFMFKHNVQDVLDILPVMMGGQCTVRRPIDATREFRKALNRKTKPIP